MVKQKNKTTYTEAIGRRKGATCRLRLYLPSDKDFSLKGKTLKKGEYVVNDLQLSQYFPGSINESISRKPFILTNSLERFVVSAHVVGGGKKGQLMAFVLASARALLKVNIEYREVLKSEGLLTVDDRNRERRKAGMGGKARRARQSPKR